MRRMTILLVCAALAASSNAVPHGKIFSTHHESGSFVSASASANADDHQEYGRQESAKGAPYWWMAADSSPFGGHGKQTVEIKGNAQVGANQAAHHQGNPFLIVAAEPHASASPNAQSHQVSGQKNIHQSVSCGGQGKICVAKHLCINGYVSDSVQGLTQVRSDDQQCNIEREACCTLSNRGHVDQTAAGSFNQIHVTGSRGNSRPTSGGIFDNSYEQQELDLSAGDQVQQTVDDSNGYLPPIGSEPSSNVPAFSKPPVEDDPEPVPSASGPAPTHVQLGCAAALICVEEELCGMDGMINASPLSLTSEQLLRRVPLSDCKNPDNGVIGKCCRDPNYVDPWPTGNLPANYSGGFDEQGFPSFLNIQKTNPTKKPSVQSNKNVISPVKGIPQRPKQNFPTIPPQIANIPVQISQGFNNIFGGNPFRPSSTVAPVTSGPSNDAPVTQKPNRPFPSFPNFPSLPNPFNKHNYDESPTNENPVVIAPHVPGSQCGVKNSVQRPSGLSDVDVAFGEIPWQAMILSNREKKLLCSGAFIAPNAVLTAARCVDGYEPSRVSVKAGEWKLGYELKHEEPLPFEIVTVSAIAQHPGYQSGYPSHDVAILFLEHPVHLDQHVDTICVTQQPPQSARNCISTGWGKHILQSHLAGALMHSINVDIIDEQECRQRLENAETQLEIDDSLVCVKAQRQNNNLCQVDLGGPLACDRGDGYYEIVGVYNQDTGCLPTNQVATFATIDYSWVQYTLSTPPQVRVESYTPTSVPHFSVEPYTPTISPRPLDGDSFAVTRRPEIVTHYTPTVPPQKVDSYPIDQQSSRVDYPQQQEQQNINYPTEEQQHSYGHEEEQENIYSQVEEQQNVQAYPPAREHTNTYRQEVEQENSYAQAEKQQHTYVHVEEQQKVEPYPPARKHQNTYRQEVEQENTFAQAEKQKHTYSQVEQEQNVAPYPTNENHLHVEPYPSAKQPQIRFDPYTPVQPIVPSGSYAYPAKTCECQQSNLPPENNQYLPPV